MNQQVQEVSDKKFTVSDILAINRTVLANERTFLAYFRTSATFLIAGISLIKFFNELYTQLLGFLLLFAAGFIAFYGVIKYDSMKNLILEERNVRHAHDINHDHETMLYVPKIMWDMLQRAYARMTLHEK